MPVWWQADNVGLASQPLQSWQLWRGISVWLGLGQASVEMQQPTSYHMHTWHRISFQFPQTSGKWSQSSARCCVFRPPDFPESHAVCLNSICMSAHRNQRQQPPFICHLRRLESASQPSYIFISATLKHAVTDRSSCLSKCKSPLATC